jgi:prepilin-type N-terminal cleavage/methylation domain-containing protein
VTRPRRSGFTLIELLIVLFMIGVLVSMLMPVIGSLIRKAERARAMTEIDLLRVALTEYLADHRRYPHLAGYATSGELLQNDAPALYAGLLNHPSPGLGGGQNGPYLEEWGGVGVVVDVAKLAADTMSKDGLSGVRRLQGEERAQAQTVPYQQQHHPGSASPLVLLDPWGSPYAYREWASVRASAKQALLTTPIPRSGFSAPPNSSGDAPVAGPVPDRPHNLSGVDIWSFGPNGINEYGAGDDVASWHAN